MPSWFFDIEDAQLLGVKPWELEDVPTHWRQKARLASVAKKEALATVAKKAKAMGVYVLEL